MDKGRLGRITAYAAFGVLVLLVLAGSYFRVFDNYELDTLDLRFRLRPAVPTTQEVVFIDIGNDTIAKLGQFPLDRGYHAVLLTALSQAGARSIIFDIFFSEPSQEAKSDQEFREAIASAGNVYLPYVLNISGAHGGHQTQADGYAAESLVDFTEEAKATGHINISPDSDGKFRRVPLVIEQDGAQHPYLALLLGMHYLGVPYKNMDVHPGKYIAYGQGRKIPLDEQSNIVVNFSGKWGETYSHYSYVDVLQSYIAQMSGEQPALDLSVFRDKICLIGLTAEGTVDLHPTPFEALYPSVGIHAEVFNSIINQNFVRRASRTVNLGLLVFLLTGIVYFALRSKPIKAFWILIGWCIAYLTAAAVVFDGFGWWVDLFYPAVAMFLTYLLGTLWRYVSEWRKRIIFENELQIAKKIQESFLPKHTPKTGGCEIVGTMLTAKQVGGDLYDYLEFGNDKLGIMIGDVTGKGVPASLFMAMVVGAFKFFAKEDTPPEESLQLLNKKIIRESSSKLFVTMYYAVFDTRNKIMHYGNGGHLPVIYAPKEGEPQFLDVEDGLPIGMIDGRYTGRQMKYHEGDLFVFYTDGITEAANKGGEMYGANRLEALIKKTRDLPVGEIAKSIEQSVRTFEPRYRQQDDVTFIIARF